MNKYTYWFGNLEGIGNAGKISMVSAGPTPEDIYNMTWEELAEEFDDETADRIVIGRSSWDLEEKMAGLNKEEARYIGFEEEEYPSRLRTIQGAPYGLYVKGRLPAEDKVCVSVVGARRCTPYGREVSYRMGEILGQNGVQVISGLARGVDASSQAGAVDSGGETYGVLGCGVDVCYPPENIKLYMDIIETGGIISEFPLGTKPLAQHFPSRNRIISGLSDLVIVVEARQKSGSLITADFALDQGRDVVAVPGRITDSLSQGCNYLIFQGADIYLGEETLEKYIHEIGERRGIKASFAGAPAGKEEKMLKKNESMVYNCLSLHPKRLEELLSECELTFMEVQGVLLDLELRGIIKETAKNCYVRSRL